MPEPTTEGAARRFTREAESQADASPAKPRARKKTEAVVDAAKLLDRLADVTSEAERAAVRLESEQSKRESLQAALKKEHALRERAERTLVEAQNAQSELSAELEAERAAREQAEAELARVDEKAAILEHQVNLTWNQLKVSEEEQGTQRTRWWRADS
jgi:hypothetical protein